MPLRCNCYNAVKRFGMCRFSSSCCSRVWPCFYLSKVCVRFCSPADGSEIPAWVEHNGGTLHFSKVARADAGNYTCVASNSLQGEIRAVVQLTVAGTVQ